MVVTHVAAPPMAGSNRAAVRHTSRRTSWATSSDWDGSLENLSDHAVHRADHPVIQRFERALIVTCHVDKQVIKILLSPPIRGRLRERWRVQSFGFTWHLRSGSQNGWGGGTKKF